MPKQKPETAIVKILEDNLGFLNDGMDPYSVAYLIIDAIKAIEPTEERIEAAARAICKEQGLNPDDIFKCEGGGVRWKWHVRYARAALTAPSSPPQGEGEPDLCNMRFKTDTGRIFFLKDDPTCCGECKHLARYEGKRKPKYWCMLSPKPWMELKDIETKPDNCPLTVKAGE